MEFATVDMDSNKYFKYVHQLVKLAHREQVMCAVPVPVLYMYPYWSELIQF
jgi:hypothetical protein